MLRAALSVEFSFGGFWDSWERLLGSLTDVGAGCGELKGEDLGVRWGYIYWV